MSRETPSHTRLSDKGRAQLDERRSRQAQALRENLRKSKAQVRSRRDQETVTVPNEGALEPEQEKDP